MKTSGFLHPYIYRYTARVLRDRFLAFEGEGMTWMRQPSRQGIALFSVRIEILAKHREETPLSGQDFTRICYGKRLCYSRLRESCYSVRMDRQFTAVGVRQTSRSLRGVFLCNGSNPLLVSFQAGSVSRSCRRRMTIKAAFCRLSQCLLKCLNTYRVSVVEVDARNPPRS